ncbi:MAG: KpsF/GutQ family sugar-phosphate isomerase [Candidatus Lightella neohaematopini]|nr:KpsF/GutQ family sugar-phosphate isomerase [Candidatus Lightella neohaematopini]MCV2528895.1 KpsF/GutQ family sugar-phosphate isomerase [Candidatus Lightella neohaematopini]
MSFNKLLMSYDFISTGKSILRKEINCLKKLNKCIDINFHNACQLILYCTGKVITMGVGKSGHIAKKIAATFSSTGTPSFFIHPNDAGHGDLGMISSNDIIVILSNSGESRELLVLIPTLKYLKVNIISITRNTGSTIGKISKVNIYTNITQEVCIFGLAPTTSTAAMLIIGDTLAITLSKVKKFTLNKFILSHPEGTIKNTNLIKVSDVMRNIKDLPIIYSNISLYEVMKKINNYLGIVIICNKDNNVIGIITNKDIKNFLFKNINLKQISVSLVMKTNLISIGPNQPLINAINLIKLNRIKNLIVIDNYKLIGIINIYDIFT